MVTGFWLIQKRESRYKYSESVLMSSVGLGLATQVVVMAIIISVIVLFVGIGALVLNHICVVGRAFRRSGNGNGNVMDRGSFGSRSMSQGDIENLPCFDFKARVEGSSPVDCAVCLENFKVGDKCRLLPLCKHSFHAQCVDLWLFKTPICPICRTRAASGRSTEIGDSQTGDTDHFSDTGEVGIEQRQN